MDGRYPGWEGKRGVIVFGSFRLRAEAEGFLHCELGQKHP